MSTAGVFHQEAYGVPLIMVLLHIWQDSFTPLLFINLQLHVASVFAICVDFSVLDALSFSSLLPLKSILFSSRYACLQLTISELFISVGSPASSLYPISYHPMPAILYATHTLGPHFSKLLLSYQSFCYVHTTSLG